MKPKISQRVFRIWLIIALSLSVVGVNLFHVSVVHALASDAFWYGGSGNYSDYTNHWSNNDGDSPHSNYGGIPSSTTNIHFTALSDTAGAAFTVTVDANRSCLNFDSTGVDVVPTFALGTTGNTYALSVYGTFSSSANSLFNLHGNAAAGGIVFASTSAQTITTNGAHFYWDTSGQGAIVFNGVSGSWALQDNLSLGNSGNYPAIIVVTNGTFNANGKSISDVASSTEGSGYGGFSMTGGATTLGASSLTLSGQFSITSGTFSGASSTITMPYATQFYGNGNTFGTVVLSASNGTVAVRGANTYTNLTRTGSADFNSKITFNANQTIGTLTLNGNSPIYRLFVSSETLHTQYTLTATTASCSNVDFQDIVGAGAGNWNLASITGGSGDCGDNTGITFTTGANEYAVSILGAINWSDSTRWSSTSGGIGGSGRVPLPQDTAIFDNNSVVVIGAVITIDVPRMSGINTIGLVTTYSPTFSATNVYCYGNVFNLAGIQTWSVTNTYLYCEKTNDTLGTGNSTIGGKLYIDVWNLGAVTLNYNVLTTGIVYLVSGVLNLANYSLVCLDFDSKTTTTYTRTLAMGSGTVTLNDTAASNKWYVSSTNFTLYCNTSTIVMTNSSTTTQQFYGAGQTYYNLTIQGAGVYTVNFNDSNTFTNVTIDRSVAAKTITGNYTLTLTSGMIMPVSSTTTITFTNVDLSMASGVVATNYIVFSSGANTCTATGGATFYAGANSTGSPQTGWSFTSPTLPSVSSSAATPIGKTTATLNGNVTSLGNYPSVSAYFEYSTSPTLATYTSTSPVATETTIGLYAFSLTGLNAEATYYFRAVLYTSDGQYVRGTVLSFVTAGAPVVITQDATLIGNNSGTINGYLSDLGDYTSVLVYFEYGLTTAYELGTTPKQTATAATSFSSNLTDLLINTKYYYRADVDYVNAGTTYTVNGTGDYFTTNTVSIFKIVSANVFSGYLETGDMLITAEIVCKLSPYYPSQSAAQYFTLQLLGTDDATVYAATTLKWWGDNPESIYLSAATVAALGLTDGSAYHIALILNPATSEKDYALTSADWQGTDLAKLDTWCRNTATSMEIFNNVPAGTYVIGSTDNDQVITDAAGGYFTTGIPQISVIRPSLFQTTKSKADVTLGVANDQWTGKHVWATQVGSYIDADFTAFGAVFGVTGQKFAGYLILMLVIILSIFGITVGGKGLVMVALCFPLTIWGAIMGAFAIQWLILPCIAMIMLWARQFWVKPT